MARDYFARIIGRLTGYVVIVAVALAVGFGAFALVRAIVQAVLA